MMESYERLECWTRYVLVAYTTHHLTGVQVMEKLGFDESTVFEGFPQSGGGD